MFGKSIYPIFFIAFAISCVPAFDRSNEGVDVNFQNAEVKNLLDLQDEQKRDSLLLFLNDENPTLAFLATMAFASYNDESVLDSLYAQLSHPSLEVRAAAAYSIGQIKNAKGEKALIEAFKNKDTLDINNSFNANILEAIGKCGSEQMLNAMATISTYRKTDTFLLLGQVRGLYRYALRGKTVQAGTDRMINIVLDNAYPILGWPLPVLYPKPRIPKYTHT